MCWLPTIRVLFWCGWRGWIFQSIQSSSVVQNVRRSRCSFGVSGEKQAKAVNDWTSHLNCVHSCRESSHRRRRCRLVRAVVEKCGREKSCQGTSGAKSEKRAAADDSIIVKMMDEIYECSTSFGFGCFFLSVGCSVAFIVVVKNIICRRFFSWSVWDDVTRVFDVLFVKLNEMAERSSSAGGCGFIYNSIFALSFILRSPFYFDT